MPMTECPECETEYLKTHAGRKYCSMTCKRRAWFRLNKFEQRPERQAYKARWIKIRRIEKAARGFTWAEIKQSIQIVNECYWCGKETLKLYCTDEHRKLFEAELSKELFDTPITDDQLELWGDIRYKVLYEAKT